MGSGIPVNPDKAFETAATSPTIIIGTPDRTIASVEESLAPHVTEGQIVLHLSGALPSSLLARCRARKAAIGSMHPLQSFADPEATLAIIEGSIFACEGDEPAVQAGFEIARAIGGQPIRIQTESKTIYHAAAAAASNFMIAPILLGLDLMQAAGIDRETGLKALTPLILGTAKNAIQVGVPDALTGPIERNDRIVIQDHIESIRHSCPEHLKAYIEMARLTIAAAERKGKLSGSDADKLRELLPVDISDTL